MYKAGLFFSLIAVSAACAADGIVVDPSGHPIAQARVVCAGSTAETGLDGRFNFPGIASCGADVSAPGFAAKHIEILSGQEARVEMTLAPLAERVVVSAVRRETTPEEAAISASVVTTAELAARDYPALGDVLPQVPGLQVTQYGRPGSLTQAFARGGARTGVLVMIDGVPVNDPGGELNLAGFNTVGMDRIEVVRGPESALFGAEASSGVIQLFTKRGSPEDRVPHGSLSYERGSFQTDRWTANLAGGAGSRLDYAFAADQFHTVGEYVNDYFRDTTGTANVGYRIAPSTEVRGIFRTFDAIAGNPNQVGYGIYDFGANEATRDTLVSTSLSDVRGSHFAQTVRFGYHRSWDLSSDPTGVEATTVTALVRDTDGSVPRSYFEGLLTPGATVPAGLREVMYTSYPYASTPYLTLSSRKDVEYQGTWTHTGGALVFGYAYERQDATISGTPVDRDNHGVFLSEQYSVTRRLYLSGGIRLEQNSAFHTKVTPRGGASYLLAGAHGALSATYLRASAGLGITDPSLLENFARESFYVGNPSLRPEKNTSYELGLVQEWFGHRLRTEVSAFDNRLKDLIVYSSRPYPLLSTWENLEGGRARGVEFSTVAKIASWLSANATYTHMKSRVTASTTPGSIFTGIGQELPHRAGNSGALSFTATRSRWMLTAGASLVGERQDPDQYVFGVNRNPGYQNVFASGSFRITKNFVPYLHAGNLLGQNYQEVLGYPAQSRNVNGGLRIQW